MTRKEFIPIARALQARWWAFPIPGSALDQYHRDLADFSGGAVSAAVAAMSAGGRDRPPTAGQIRRQVAEMELDAPAWEKARTILHQWRNDAARRQSVDWQCPFGRCDGSAIVMLDDEDCMTQPCECRDELVAARRGYEMLPPLVLEFVSEGHLSRDELDKVFGGDTTAEAQLRNRWQQFTERAIETRVLATLPEGLDDLPRIESAREEDRERIERHGGELRRFSGADAVALLEREAS